MDIAGEGQKLRDRAGMILHGRELIPFHVVLWAVARPLSLGGKMGPDVQLV